MKPASERPVRGSKLTRGQIVELFSRLRELNPEPTTELEYTSPFELLVAVILSAQATDVGVNKAMRKLFPVANTPRAILALGAATIPEVDVVDSTLLAGDGSALRVSALTLGPGQSPTGGRVAFDHVTLVGPPAGPGFGFVVPQAVPVHIANSVGVSGGAFLCGPGAALTSGGGNTFSDLACALTGPGDQTGVDPLLGPLGDHGGTGRTRVPSASSPLVDTAVGSTSTADQRGVARPHGSGSDRGAVERTFGD